VWTSTQAAAPDEGALKRVTTRLEQDPPIVSTSAGSELVSAWYEPLYALARSRLGVPDVRDPQSSGRVVRVAVLDTAADARSGIVDRSGHGRAVSRVVSQLACGDLQPCAAELQHVSALGLDSREAFVIKQAAAGQGALGTRGALAAAIDSVVTQWEQQRAAGNAPRRLIINLSLGWSGCWESGQSDSPLAGDLFNSKRSLASQTVLKALARASCAGALVVAAGGNGIPDSACAKQADSGNRPRHVFPGLWGGSPLEPKVCSELLGREPVITETVPLLIGVGAVDDDDDQLAITDHEADLVAYGQAVVMPDSGLASGYTRQLSGTSMSAAAFSGVAAAVLGYRPELETTELLSLIRAGAVPLRAAPLSGAAGAADFICNTAFAAESCKEVRRLSLCGALAKASIGATCSAARAGLGFATMSAAAPTLEVVDCDSCIGDCPEECSLPTDEDEVSALPWVTPQPKPPACGTCAAVRTPLLFQAQFLYAVNHAVLRLNFAGGVQRNYALTGAAAAGTTPTTWLLPASAAGASSAFLMYRASISMKKESGDIVIHDLPPFTPAAPLVEP
jgi:hypothetical protein